MRGWFYRKRDPFPFHFHVENESMKYGGKGTNKQKSDLIQAHHPSTTWSWQPLKQSQVEGLM